MSTPRQIVMPVTLQSYKTKSVRTAVLDILMKHPDATDEERIALYKKRVQADEELLDLTVEYVWMLQLNAINRQPYKHRNVQDLVNKGKLMLLDLLMPNGKPMRECTGAEMISFGGSFTRIGQKVGAKRLVGTLTEDQVKGLMK